MTTIAVPEAAFDKHVVLFGMTGAGKTSVIKTAIVEPDLEAGRRVLIITPKDDWWGLRLSKTGKSAGFDIPIFGGFHADYPLLVKDAALLAETYGTMKGSAIFCTSRLSVQDRARWFAAFAERLLSANRGWVRVVIDEAHVFMPKQGAKGGGAIPAGLHAGNELVSQGRSLGLRIVLASQRSAKLHNDASTQCSCLVAMLLMAPADREAVKDWIEDQADPQRGKEIIASLANQKPGQAWVWAPAAKFLDQVQFARPSTFDSSAAPDEGGDADHKLKPINLDALKGKLATIEAERKANDPAELKAEIAKLRAEKTRLEHAKPAAPEKPDKAAIKAELSEKQKKAIERAAVRGKIEGHADAMKAAGGMMESLGKLVAPLRGQLDELQRDIATIEKWATREQKKPTSLTPVTGADVDQAIQEPGARTAAAPRPSSSRPTPPRVARTAPSAMSGDASISRTQQAILDAVAEMEMLCGKPPPRTLVAIMTGYQNMKSTGFAKALSSLSANGHVAYPDSGTVTLTESGNALANPPSVPATSEEIQSRVIAILGPTAGKILTNVIAVYPDAMDRQELAQQSGYENVKSTGFAKSLSRLSALGFITYPSARQARAGDVLFP
ncbi:MAG: hypothetical protein E6G97_07380 [Alphaproteobacteria bacterium]|nr:MAG: hypothetical protein E6G97_07380 [Alphaproteobacteria bacterium]